MFVTMFNNPTLTWFQALEFSKWRSDDVAVNTVFGGFLHPKFVMTPDGKCINEDPVPAWDCYMKRNPPVCRLRGLMCKGVHSLDMGHLFPARTKCSDERH